MRHRFIDLIKRFHSDERGVFLVIFGLLAIVIIATSGAVVDFVAMEQARTRAQVALDAAALALQPEIYTETAETLRDRAERLVKERLVFDRDRSVVTVSSAVINAGSGSLTLNAGVNVPTMFVSLVGVTNIKANLVSEATRKKLKLDVAFVLDNSRSMLTDDRIGNLIDATRCAVNILFNDNCYSTATAAANPNVKIGMVPFTMLVNVGTNNATASWLDRAGNTGTAITNDNFDNNDDDTTAMTGAVDRIALMNQLTNTDWGGCVEARLSPYDTNDAEPVVGTATMFTPMFAPDEPDTGGFSNSYLSDSPASCNPAPTWVWRQTKYSCDRNGNTQSTYDAAVCSGGAAILNEYYSVSPLGVVTITTSTRPATLYNNPDPGASAYSSTYATLSGSGSERTLQRVRTWTYVYSQRELQERMCKYTGASASGISQASAHGPNSDCPFNPITPMSNDKPTVTAAVNALAAQGGTNIHAGTEWGFRVLSPTAPFTEGEPYDQATSKVMIIMTDGENTAYQTANMNNTVFYSHYGFPWNGRMGTASSTDTQLEDEMNARLLTTCTNAKAEGILIYTIGLEVALTNRPTVNTQMLKDCSSGVDYWFFPDDPTELITVFTEIAQQLANLRLAK